MQLVRGTGNYLRHKVLTAQLMFIVCIVILVILALTSLPNTPFYLNVGYEGVRTLSMLFPAIGIFYFLRMYRTNRLGIEGEEKVTSVLQRSLNDYYFLINNVVYSDSRGKKRDIDHILLGPNAIFAIETKNWIRLYYDPTEQARRNAQWVQRTLTSSKVLGDRKLWVQAVLVFLNFPDAKRLSTQNVEVMNVSDLVDYVQSHGHNRLSLREIEAMAKILCEATQ